MDNNDKGIVIDDLSLDKDRADNSEGGVNELKNTVDVFNREYGFLGEGLLEGTRRGVHIVRRMWLIPEAVGVSQIIRERCRLFGNMVDDSSSLAV